MPRSCTFLIHIIPTNGMKPDPDKVKAIDNVPQPIDIKGVQRFNGFVNYLAKFLPKLNLHAHIYSRTGLPVKKMFFCS